MSFKRLALAALSLILVSTALPVEANSIPSKEGLRQSYLFGAGARSAFSGVRLTEDEQWNSTYWYNTLKKFDSAGFKLLPNDFGSTEPKELAVVIRNRSYLTVDSQKFVETLSKEKFKLMNLYGLTNREYNRLAAMSFGILGRETQFGTNLRYYVKERAQLLVQLLKAAEEGDFSPEATSRGLTQIKNVPAKIAKAYGIDDPEQLRDPAMAAVATIGFLAESLEYTKYRARVRELSYIDAENIYDYILYVYFGSVSQLQLPKLRYMTTGLSNKVATPEKNLYLQTVKTYLKGLVLLEKP